MTADEIKNQISTLTAEADQLNEKPAAELSEDEKARLAELVAQLEQLQSELKDAETKQRFALVKERNAAPSRQLPRFESKIYATPKASVGEGLSLFFRSRSHEADNSPEAHYKMRSLNLNVNSGSAIQIPMNWKGLNFKDRTVLSKGGSGTGADYVWQSFSDKVVEYLTYESPLVGMYASETTSDGNLRTYFKHDDTAMKSTYTSASGGSELSPTIPQTNFVTAKVQIGCFDITSGRQEITFNELRDSYISLEDKVAKANGRSHARQIESESILAAGNGTTGVQGIDAVDTALTAVAAWTPEVLENLYFSVPAQYRKECVYLSNPDTYANVFSVMKDDDGRSLFDRTAEDGIEYDVLNGKKFLQSDYVPADKIFFFNPTFYQLRIVAGQLFKQFDERYWPNVAWAGIMTFGGTWLGPTSACKSVAIDTE